MSSAHKIGPHPLIPVSKRKSSVREIDQQIGHHLRELYESVLTEPIPERLLNLVEELTNEETTASNDATSEFEA